MSLGPLSHLGANALASFSVSALRVCCEAVAPREGGGRWKGGRWGGGSWGGGVRHGPVVKFGVCLAVVLVFGVAHCGRGGGGQFMMDGLADVL